MCIRLPARAMILAQLIQPRARSSETITVECARVSLAFRLYFPLYRDIHDLRDHENLFNREKTEFDRGKDHLNGLPRIGFR